MDGSTGIFAGVRFVLSGFDPASEAQYRLELTQKGAVDLGGEFNEGCTHVIVSGLIYDDPVCVLARNEGKVVVNETWVDDSLDLGNLADPTRILYKPVKELNGIPGARSLIICLTGYVRQQRDDIMRMVNLMGARFSKPLVANQVTHLICYKFEGEKYELAKRVDIKLVNHCWLEDCLKTWAIQPEESYAKSGYDLELEGEAKDSDEETDDEVAPVQTYHAFNARTPNVIPNPSLKSSPAPIRPSQTSNFSLKSTNAPNRPSQNSNLSLKSPNAPNKSPSQNSNLSLKSSAPNRPPSQNSNLSLKSPAPNKAPSQNSNLSLKSSAPNKPPSQNSNLSLKSPAPSSYRDVDAQGSKNRLNSKPNSPVKTPFIKSPALNHSITPLQYSGPSIKSPALTPPNEPSSSNTVYSGSRITTPTPSPANNEPSPINKSPLQNSGSRITTPTPSPANNEPSPINKSPLQNSGSRITTPTPSPANNEPSPINKSPLQNSGSRITTPTPSPANNEPSPINKSPLQNSGSRITTPTPSPANNEPSPINKSPLQNSGSRITTPTPSPANNEPSPINKSPLQNSGSRITTPTPSPANNEPSLINKSPLQNSGSRIKRPTMSPDNSEPSRTSNSAYSGSRIKSHASSPAIELSPHGDGSEISPVGVINPASITQERDDLVTPKSSDGKSQNLSKTLYQEVGSIPQGSGSTNIAQSGTKLVKVPKIKSGSGKGFSVPVRNTQDSTKNATPNLSENTEICSDKQIDSTNCVQKGKSSATPQSGRTMSSSYKPPLIKTPVVIMSDSDQSGTKKDDIVPQCKEFSRNIGEPGFSSKKDQTTPPCKEFTPSVSSKGTRTSSKLSTNRKKSISPVEQPTSENVEMEKSVLPQKRKACDESNSDSLFVANDFKELEEMDALTKGDKPGSGGTGTGTGTTNTGTGTGRKVRKTLSQKRKSLKRAKPHKENSDTKMEEANNAHQLNVNKEIGSCSKEKVTEAVTPVPDNHGDIEMRNILKDTKPRTLEIKGLSPESMEIDSKLPSCEKSNENDIKSSNNKLAPSVRIKKAVAKRSIKSAQANPATNSFNRKLGSNNTDIDTAKNAIAEQETEKDKKNQKDKLKEIITEEETRKDKREEIIVNEENQKDKPKEIIIKEKSRQNKLKGITKKEGTRKYKPKAIITEEVNNSRTNPETDRQKGKDKDEISKFSSNKSNITMDWLLTSLELDPEKENKQEDHDDGKSNKNAAQKINKKPESTNKNKQVIESVENRNGTIVNAGTDLLKCFILSGHTFQKKEFQVVIKKLKGRVCRDSHNWSFQATHFIVPGPIRRTEKFFAAASSGRWILNMDYLTSSLSAGHFIEEQPYEWHGSGLTEDSTVSLEAPRKWRMLKERTGHGAFYGWKVVVYGQCVAPKLDTLKRVIKAGDGTVVATCPPYNRSIKSGIDLCVVPDTTPSDDPWICEFLNNKIACVTSDFLVEFVCKPGHSLAKHVLFETHDWADRVLEKFEKLSQEVVRPLALGEKEDKNEDELECVVCRKSDRGEVMLICGDESGEIGCGLGTHIDCCNPKLKRVPEEDWFCDSCRVLIGRNKSTKRRGTKAK